MPTARSGKRFRKLAIIVACLVLAGCGERAAVEGTPTPARFTPSPRPSVPVQEAAPRWETVATFSGSQPAETPPFRIMRDAIQWRTRYNCKAGRLRIDSTPPPKNRKPLVDAVCPAQGEAYSISNGSKRLNIQGTGEWTAIVDQQVSTPLLEPLPEEVTSPPIAQGAFYNLEKEGKGTAKLFELSDGRRILRFEDFEVTNNTDLFVWLSEAPHPNNSAESIAAPHFVLGNLRSTLGTQNYEVPPEVPTREIRSVIIWCQPVSVAYSAASLSP